MWKYNTSASSGKGACPNRNGRGECDILWVKLSDYKNNDIHWIDGGLVIILYIIKVAKKR